MKKRWIGMGILTAISATVLAVNVNQESAVSVRGVTIQPQRVEQTVTCVGVVEATDGLPIVMPIDCHIARVEVKSGQRVKKGDVLATLDRESTEMDVDDPADSLILAAMDESIIAPEDGVVMMVKAESGQTLKKGTPCLVLARDSDIQVRIGIREKDLKQLEKGMNVRVRGEGFANDDYTGELTEISSAARMDTEGGTVVEGIVTLTKGQVDQSFRLGLTAKALVVTSVNENGLVIPYEAILSDAMGDYVFVVEDETAVLRRLSSQVRTAEGVVVSDGDWEGLTVVIHPQELQDGMTVSVMEGST